MSKLRDGLHCKACNKPMPSGSMDLELCNECYFIVVSLNADLYDTTKNTDFVELLEDEDESD